MAEGKCLRDTDPASEGESVLHLKKKKKKN